MSEAIALVSGKGGTGKTTACCNLGTGLSKLGKRVVVMDMDLGMRSLDLLLGQENQIIYNWVDVIEENCDLAHALIREKRFPGLFLLPAALTRREDAITVEQVRRLVDTLKQEFDYVLLDAPPGISKGFSLAVAGADSSILVTLPEENAVRDADFVRNLLRENRGMRIRLLINRMREDLVKGQIYLSKEEILEILPVSLLGVIPDDDAVYAANRQGTPIVGRACLAGQAFAACCRQLLRENEKQ